jgi:hypothetical protein
MKPNTSVTSPLEKGDHPELDTSELFTTEQIAQYQFMIGALQCIVTIGCFDIITAVMIMSGFRMAPRVGHLNRLKRIYGYLLESELKSLTTLTFLSMSMTVRFLSMARLRRYYQQMPLNHLGTMSH